MQGFAWLAAGELVARALGFVATIVMARQLMPDAFGVVALGLTLVTWFRLAVDSGTEVLSMRDIARRPETFRRTAGLVIGLRLTLSVVAAALFLGAAALLAPTAGDRTTLMLFALCLPMIALNMRFMVLGVRSSNAVAYGNIASQLLLVIGVVALVNDQHDGDLVALLQATSELLYGLVVLAVVGRRFGIPLPTVRLADWKRTLAAGLPVAVTNLARTVIYSADVLLIAALMDRHHVGLYVAAQRPMMFGMGVVALFTTSFLASFSAADAAQSRELFVRAVRVAAGVSVAMGVALAIGAGFFIDVAFGTAYGGAALPLAILAAAFPLIALTGPYTAALLAADRQRVVMRNNIAAAGLNLAANVVAIPALGIRGAALTTVLGFAAVLVLNQRSAVGRGLAPSLFHVFDRRLPPVAPQAQS